MGVFSMKRTIILLVSLCMFLSLVGCGNHSVQSVNKYEGELYTKAMEILDEFKDETEIQDFLVAYDLLMTLPDDEDGFIKQLGKVNDIYSKYGVELHYGDYYLGKPGTFGIDAESIEKYKSKAAYYDAEDLLNSIVYPILFEKYGDDAQAIEGITAEEIIYAINSTKDYVIDKESESYDGFTKKWKYTGVPTTGYEIKYHSNGLVESINVPIIRSSAPLTDADYTAILNKPMDEQKTIAENRFAALINEFNTFFAGYEVLSRIFTDKELEIISNYIHSITTDELWKRNLAFYGGSEPTTYTYAIVSFDYKGNDISINYGLNGIYLRIKGKNYVNQLSNKWYTVWLGLCEKGYGEEIVDLYSPYIENDVSLNDTVQEWSYDLDANADKFATATIHNSSPSEKKNAIETEYYVEVFTSEAAVLKGTIARTNEEFPTFCLILENETKITLKDMDISQEYTCAKLYFYDDADVNGGYDYASLVGKRYSITAQIEDYRGVGRLFLYNPVITEIN